MKGMLLRVLIVVGLLALVAPAPAGAASRAQIQQDCEDDDRLSGTYTPGELRDARDNLGSDQQIYSSCADVLRAALQASARRRSADSGATGGSTGAGGAAGSGQSGGSAAPSVDLNSLDTKSGADSAPAPSPEDLTELRTAREDLPEVDVRGQRVVPGVQGVAGQAATATVPGSLIVALVLLGLTAVLALVPLVRRRVLARRAA